MATHDASANALGLSMLLLLTENKPVDNENLTKLLLAANIEINKRFLNEFLRAHQIMNLKSLISTENVITYKQAKPTYNNPWRPSQDYYWDLLVFGYTRQYQYWFNMNFDNVPNEIQILCLQYTKILEEEEEESESSSSRMLGFG